MEENIVSNNLFIISNLEIIRVLSDPLRLRIFQHIRQTSQTGVFCSVKMLAQKLNLPQTKLYYHVKLLEQHRLIEVAETHLVSGILEKLYHTRVEQIVISQQLLSQQPEGGESILSMLSGILESTLAEVRQNISGPHRPIQQPQIAFTRRSVNLTEDQALIFQQQLEAFIQEHLNQEHETEPESTNRYSFIYIFYPNFTNNIPDENQYQHG